MNTSYITESLSRRISFMSLVSAVLVVFIHVPHEAQKLTFGYFCSNFISEGVCNIAVPYFFVVSGFMLARHCDECGWWLQALNKRIRTILIPYLIWCLVITGILTVNAIYANRVAGRPLLANLGGLFPFNFLGLSPFANPPSPLWYLRTLFLFVLISSIIVHLVRSRFQIYILCLLFVIDLIAVSWIAPLSRGVSHIVWFTFSFSGLFYFACGCYLCFVRIVIRKSFRLPLILVGGGADGG